MQDWVKKILNPFKKNADEEVSSSGSFSSWESMNPDELPHNGKDAKPRPAWQKSALTLSILVGLLLAIMAIQFSVQKLLNTNSEQTQTAEQSEAPATTEIASTAAPESIAAPLPAPTETAPTAEVATTPAPTTEAPATTTEETSTAPIVAQPYTPKYNEQGEEELPILAEKAQEGAPSTEVATVSPTAAPTGVEPDLAQVKPLYAANPNEEVLPILQETTETASAAQTEVAANPASDSPAAEAYAPQYNASGEEELPILTEKTTEAAASTEVATVAPTPAAQAPASTETENEPATTVVVLGENQAATESAAPVTIAPSPTPAPAETTVASVPPAPAPTTEANPQSAPVVIQPTPEPAPAPVAIAAAPAPEPKRAATQAAPVRKTYSPEWLAKQNEATRRLLAQKAEAVKGGKKTIVVKSAAEASKVAKTAGSAVVTEVQVQAETPGFVEEESQSIASIGRQ